MGISRHQVVAQVVIKAAEDPVASVDYRDLRAEAGEYTGELDRDEPTAYDEHTARLRGEVEHLVGGYCVLDARYGPIELGPCTRGDEDDLRGDGLPRPRQAQPAWGLDDGAACDQRNIVSLQGVTVGRLEAGDLGAGRALARIGLADADAGADLRELRELLQGWRDARSGIWGQTFDKFVRGVMALLLAALAVQLGLGEFVQ